MGKYLKLEEITAYKIASELSDYIWEIIGKWDWLKKKILGAQWIESIDSIAANIAEGFGRYHKKDKIKFFYNSRGSLYESVYWTKKAFIRRFITKEEYNHILLELRKLPKEINNLIRLTSQNLSE